MQAWADYLEGLRAGDRELSWTDTTSSAPPTDSLDHSQKGKKAQELASQMELAFLIRG